MTQKLCIYHLKSIFASISKQKDNIFYNSKKQELAQTPFVFSLSKFKSSSSFFGIVTQFY